MPELPEVESVVRSLRDGSPSLVGARIDDVDILWYGVVSSGTGIAALHELAGTMVTAVCRHGKYLLLHLVDSEDRKMCLVIHLRMTGRLTLVPMNTDSGHHTRLSLSLNTGYSLHFDDPRKFGRVWLVNHPDEVVGALGPDALGISEELFVSRLRGHRRHIKPLLLDQSYLAGIGNIYADESLFRAGIHPLSRASELSADQMARLHQAVVAVLDEAVEFSGANIDGVFKAGKFVVSVYGREGQPCRVCGSEISKIRVGQRGTHVCRTCQPPPASGCRT